MADMELGKPTRVIIGGVTLIFFAFIAWVVAAFIWTQFIRSKPGPGVAFSATVIGYHTSTDTSYLDVTLSATNTGTVAAVPICTVRAHDDSQTHVGVDYARPFNKVAPGATVTIVKHLYITLYGAQDVTDVSVTCLFS